VKPDYTFDAGWHRRHPALEERKDLAFNMVIMEGDHARFMTVLERLREESNAKFVFLVDKAGQQIAKAGDMEGVDPTALASLTAGNVAATEGVAQIVGEKTFSTLFHEGEKESLHINGVLNLILLVVFDERSSLGLVRLRVQQHTPQLGKIMEEILTRSRSPGSGEASSEAFPDITEDDIDALFG
jgi:predicted regulator of Ras-like GTPase activity (Roadblock/LC7/MglB family)